MSETPFEGAIQVLDKYGWHQGGYGDMHQGYCVWGAVRRVALTTLYSHFGVIETADKYFSKAAEKLDPGHTWPGWRWQRTNGSCIWNFNPATYNDDKNTTVEDVKSLLKEANELYKKGNP